MSRKIGFDAEKKALEFLQKKGFRLIEQNYYSRFGEIDLIMIKDNTLHFIEVKSGQGEPIYNITPKKLSKIIKTSQFYLNQKKLDMDYCFDAIIVKETNIELIENITF